MAARQIYMPLANEGTDAWVRVVAEDLGVGRFRILGPTPQDQEWKFAPGTIVNARKRTFASGEIGLVAFEASRPK